MKVIPRKCGNTKDVVPASAILREVGLSAGQAIALETTGQGKVVFAFKKHSLVDLIAQGDLESPPPNDLGLWDVAKPVGREIW